MDFLWRQSAENLTSMTGIRVNRRTGKARGCIRDEAHPFSTWISDYSAFRSTCGCAGVLA